MPAPSYTVGDWGYDIISGNDIKIVSYYGASGDIVIPSTIENGGVTYTVTQLGKGPSGNTIMDESIICDNLTLPDTITRISNSTFQDCTGLSGNLKIPDIVEFIGSYSFHKTNFDGTLIIPESATSVLSNAFDSTKFDSLINLASASAYRTSTFANTEIKNVLNLANDEMTTTSYGLTADEVREDVPAAGYIAPLSTTVVVTKEGAVYDLMSLLPLIMVLGIVMMGVYAVGTRYA